MVSLPLIDAQGIGFGYNGTPIFKNISFRIRSGQLFCLLGPNGCGKTTLLDCVMGHLKLQKGRISLSGLDVGASNPEQIARKIAYVPQTHDRTFPYSVFDIVLMGRAAYIGMFSRPGGEDVAIAEEALQTVGISHLRNRSYTQLSGGEGQLVMVARALAQNTPVVVMDEPTAHLDFKHEMIVLEKVVELIKEKRLAVMMATHFPNHCFYFENSGIDTEVALMSDAGFLASGSPGEVISEENLQRLYEVNTRILTYEVAPDHEIRHIVPIKSVASSKTPNDREGL